MRLIPDFGLKPFFQNRAANMATSFSLALVPIMGVTGGAVDYSRAHSVSAELRSALDSAVLTGMSVTAREKKYGPDLKVVASTAFNALPAANGASARFELKDDVLRGYATKQVPTYFMQMFGMSTLTVSAEAGAIASPQRQPACFMAMHPSRKHTLELKGSVSVLAPDCHIYGNSDHPDDVVDPHTPQNFLTGKSIQAVGFGHHYLQNLTPPLEYAPEILPDPLASMLIPDSQTCTANGLKIKSQTVTLSPGVYCGGLEISSGSKVTLQPGMYFVRGGTFSVSGSTVEGSGVTVLHYGTNKPINWNGSTIRLSAPTAGSLAGIVVTGERVASSSELKNSTVDLHGVVYLPRSEFEWTNSGTPVINAKWTSWIIDGVSWLGSGTIKINFDYKDSTVPFPPGLLSVIPRPGAGYARLIQ